MLAAQGYEQNVVSVEDVTSEILKGYNSVVLMGVPINIIDKKRGGRERIDQFVEMIKAYAQAGGGVLVLPHSNSAGQGYAYGHAAIAKAFGGRWLWEKVDDPNKTERFSGTHFVYAYTPELNAEHPVTRGLNGIWYLTGYGNRSNYSVLPFLVGPEWTVLIKGGAESTSSPMPDQRERILTVDKHPREKGYSSYVPIMVSRDFGNGRVVLCGIDTLFNFLSGHTPGLQRVVSDRGYDGRPSDGDQVIFNSIKWLCEPSLASAVFGGAKTPEGFLDDPLMTKPARAIDWTNRKFGPAPKQFKGVVGARTSRSLSGKGSVEDYVKSAREAGLDYLVFLEDYNDLTDAEWETMLSECAAARAEGFIAYPGITFKDNYGGHWFAFGEEMSLFPSFYQIEVDGEKRFFLTPPDQNTRQPYMGMHDWRRMNGFNLRTGSWNHKDTPYPYHSYRQYDSIAVISGAGAQVEEDSLDAYLHLQNRGESMYPFAVTIINSPEQLGFALEGGMYWNVMTPQTMKNLSAKPGSYASMSFMTTDLRYLSNGPLIDDFRLLAHKDYGLFGEWWRTDWYRQPLRIAASSEVGIKEVRLGVMFLKRPDGRQFKFQPVTTPNKGNNLIQFWLSYGMAADPITGGQVRGIDGARPSTTRTHIETSISSKAAGTKVRGMQFHRNTDRVINAPDIIRGWGRTDGRMRFEEGRKIRNVWWDLVPVDPADDYEEWMQRTYFSVTSERLPVEMLQRRLSVKQDIDLEQGPVRWDLGYVKAMDAKRLAIRSQGRIVYSGKIGEGKHGLTPRMLTGALVPGDYIAFYDAPITSDAFMVYDGMLNYRADLRSGHVSLSVPWDADQTIIPAGTTINYTLLGVSSPNLSDDWASGSFQFVEDFRNQMGLDGDVAYRIEPEQGRALDNNYIAVVEAQSGAFVARLEEVDLPSTLPLEVRGLNANWSVGYAELDKGRYRPINMTDDTSFVSLDPRKRRQHIFVGHPMIADDPEVVLNCVQLDKVTWHLEIHNPTDIRRKVTVTASEAFPLLTCEPVTMDLVPGRSEVRVLMGVDGK